MRYLGVIFTHFNVMAQYDVTLIDTYRCLSILINRSTVSKGDRCSASSSTTEATCPVLAPPYSRMHLPVRGLGGKDGGSTWKTDDRRGSWGDRVVSVAPRWPEAGAGQGSLVLLPLLGRRLASGEGVSSPRESCPEWAQDTFTRRGHCLLLTVLVGRGQRWAGHFLQL